MRIHIYVNVCPQCQVGSLGWQVGANGARIQIDDCVITLNTSEDSQGRAEDITSRYLHHPMEESAHYVYLSWPGWREVTGVTDHYNNITGLEILLRFDCDNMTLMIMMALRLAAPFSSSSSSPQPTEHGRLNTELRSGISICKLQFSSNNLCSVGPERDSVSVWRGLTLLAEIIIWYYQCEQDLNNASDKPSLAGNRQTVNRPEQYQRGEADVIIQYQIHQSHCDGSQAGKVWDQDM